METDVVAMVGGIAVFAFVGGLWIRCTLGPFRKNKKFMKEKKENNDGKTV